MEAHAHPHLTLHPEADAERGERAAGVDAEVALVAERPAPALVDLAADRGARYIVVGSYGEGPIRGALLGSTPHKLLQLSHTPLVIVPEGD